MNLYGVKGFLTPDSVPIDSQCRILQIPNDVQWLSVFMGALLALTYPENWQLWGELTPEESADAALDVIWDAYNNNMCILDIPAPYWQDLSGDDAQAVASPEVQEWYGRLHHSDPTFEPDLADFVFSAFLVSIGVPNAAIQFIINLRHASIAYRKGQHGAILKVFLDGVETDTIDTYAEEESVEKRTYDIVADGTVLWLEHSGEHNPSATPNGVGEYEMNVVRKNLRDEEVMFELRQNPSNSCQLQQSLDGGATWTLAFDYSLCLPPAQETIMQTVLQNNTYISPFQPNVTFISQSGYDDAQREAGYQALCYAATYVVQVMCSAAHGICTGDTTAENATTSALDIVGLILSVTVGVLTGTVLLPLALLVIPALLHLTEAIIALDCALWQDTDNQAALACLMLANLSNSPVSIENFQGAFANADCLTADQQSMASILADSLSDVSYGAQMYAAFLANVAQVNSQAQADALDAACGCSADTWCAYIKPSTARGMVTLQPSTVSAGCPECAEGSVSGDQWLQAAYTGASGGYNPGVSVLLKLYIPGGCVLNDAYAYGDYGSGVRLGACFDNTVEVICDSGIGVPADHIGLDYSGTGGTSGYHEIEFVMANNTTTNDGFIDYIILTGTGVNPLFPCDNCP